MSFGAILGTIEDLFKTVLYSYQNIVEFFFSEYDFFGLSVTNADFVLGGAITIMLYYTIAKWTAGIITG